MGLNIKNETVHGEVRELSRRLGVNQTSAIEIAVREKLAMLSSEQRRSERARDIRAAAAAAQAAFRGVDLRAAADGLYDEAGLPQ